MSDVFTREKRAEVMSRIRGRGNKDTEIALLLLFRRHRISGWRRHTTLIGRPDFTFSKQRITVFVDGCFWHGCPKHGTSPRTNAAFWSAKITANRARDAKVTRSLRAEGWRVLRIWEHELRAKNERRLLSRLRRYLPVPGQG